MWKGLMIFLVGALFVYFAGNMFWYRAEEVSEKQDAILFWASLTAGVGALAFVRAGVSWGKERILYFFTTRQGEKFLENCNLEELTNATIAIQKIVQRRTHITPCILTQDLAEKKE